ncbi:MAG: glycosyltransferase family 4 protein [Candidatus Moranbacteria bacterium]|nr:glycosyltransferase family 4 protein [Candidatus Moranbacteria bacterium]
MKIAFIGQKGIPALSGGVEKHVEKLAVHLAALGHDITVYTRPAYTDKTLKEYQGVKLISLSSIRTKHLDAVSHTFLATAHALFQNYDVVHYHSIGPSVFSILPRIFRGGMRVVATFHSRDYFHKKWNVFARLFLQLAEKITCTVPEKTIVISETLKRYAEEKYARKFSLVPNGADVAFEPDTNFLNQWGLRPKRYILSVSRLIAHKGIHYLIKAFNELENMNKIPNNFKLVIVGAPTYTKEYETYLKVLAEGHSNIIFVGEQTGKTLEELFSHAYLFVQPSEDEGLSLALLEAMGHGLMPIVSDIPANREAIANTGAFFPSKDAVSLEKELAYFINRPEDVAVLGKLAQERVQDHYSWDAIARRTFEVYEEALHQNSSAREPYASYRTK